MFYKPPKDPDVKFFRFNPADYNTTSRIVENLYYRNVTLMENGDIIIEYEDDMLFISFFTRLALHTETPDDIEPPISADKARDLKQTYRARRWILLAQILFIAAAIIYLIFFNNE